MNNRPGLGLRFRLEAITTLIATLLIALPALAQQEKMDMPRPSLSSQPAIEAQPAQPSQQGQAGQDDKDNGKKYCRIKVKRSLISTAPRTCKAFQGWRYFDSERVPPDLSNGDTADMPAEMAAELKRLGLL